MSHFKYLTNNDIIKLSEDVADQIVNDFQQAGVSPYFIYGIPRGGIPSSYMVCSILNKNYIGLNKDCPVFELTDSVEIADIFIDDIIDSGNTKNRYLAENPDAKFYALINKERQPNDNNWYIFPWEETCEASIEDAYLRIHQFYKLDPDKLETLKDKIKQIINEI